MTRRVEDRGDDSGDVDDVGNGDGNEYDDDDECSTTSIYYAIYQVGV